MSRLAAGEAIGATVEVGDGTAERFTRLYRDGGPGFEAGIGGDIAFDTSGLDPEVARRALAEGITVRLTWTEAGQRRERAFPIR